MQMKKITAIIITLTTLASFTACGKATVENVQEDLSSGNYTSIEKSFNDLTDEDKLVATTSMMEEIDSIKQGFIDGKIELSKAVEAVSTLKVNLSGDNLAKAESIITLFNNINDSKGYFADAKKKEEANDLTGAIELYSKVIAEDTVNYDVAQAKIIELNKKIEDSIPVKVVGTRLDRNIIDNQILNVQLNNKSDKAIKEVIFSVFAYDSNGYPVKLNFGYDYKMDFKYDNTLQPGETSGDNWTWDLYPQGNEVKEVVVILRQVNFYEGASWDNPLYSSACQQYEGQPLKR